MTDIYQLTDRDLFFLECSEVAILTKLEQSGHKLVRCLMQTPPVLLDETDVVQMEC